MVDWELVLLRDLPSILTFPNKGEGTGISPVRAKGPVLSPLRRGRAREGVVPLETYPFDLSKQVRPLSYWRSLQVSRQELKCARPGDLRAVPVITISGVVRETVVGVGIAEELMGFA